MSAPNNHAPSTIKNKYSFLISGFSLSVKYNANMRAASNTNPIAHFIRYEILNVDLAFIRFSCHTTQKSVTTWMISQKINPASIRMKKKNECHSTWRSHITRVLNNHITHHLLRECGAR